MCADHIAFKVFAAFGMDRTRLTHHRVAPTKGYGHPPHRLVAQLARGVAIESGPIAHRALVVHGIRALLAHMDVAAQLLYGLDCILKAHTTCLIFLLVRFPRKRHTVFCLCALKEP